MIIWLLNNLVGIGGILVGGFIAYHVYFLSKKINLRDRLVHKENIMNQVEPMLHKISKGINSKVELINIKKYLKHYPHDNNLTNDGYTYLGAELKALRFDGVEFFCAVREIYKKSDGSLTLKEDEGAVCENYNVFEAGIVPYEWIEYIDDRGDEFSYRPQFFVKFKGLEKYPYKYLTYYKESDRYNKDNDPMDFKYRKVEIV